MFSHNSVFDIPLLFLLGMYALIDTWVLLVGVVSQTVTLSNQCCHCQIVRDTPRFKGEPF